MAVTAPSATAPSVSFVTRDDEETVAVLKRIAGARKGGKSTHQTIEMPLLAQAPSSDAPSTEVFAKTAVGQFCFARSSGVSRETALCKLTRAAGSSGLTRLGTVPHFDAAGTTGATVVAYGWGSPKLLRWSGKAGQQVQVQTLDSETKRKTGHRVAGGSFHPNGSRVALWSRSGVTVWRFDITTGATAAAGSVAVAGCDGDLCNVRKEVLGLDYAAMGKRTHVNQALFAPHLRSGADGRTTGPALLATLTTSKRNGSRVGLWDCEGESSELLSVLATPEQRLGSLNMHAVGAAGLVLVGLGSQNGDRGLTVWKLADAATQAADEEGAIPQRSPTRYLEAAGCPESVDFAEEADGSAGDEDTVCIEIATRTGDTLSLRV